MENIGIIAEYNPFHNGHLYHIQKAREITGAENIICVLNGNFMQRGRPAITDKWSRTRMALSNGIDLVLELPIVYGIRSAEHFARGAVHTLASTGITEAIVFGSETDNINMLKKISHFLIEEPPHYKNLLKNNLREGLSYPSAREKAVLDYYITFTDENKLEEVRNSINTPNNILGIEYLKILYRDKINIQPFTVKRQGENYHSSTSSGKFISAGAVRKSFYKHKGISEIKDSLPLSSSKILIEDRKQGKIPIHKNYLGIIILNKLRQLSVETLKKYTTPGNGLERRINTCAYTAGSLSDLVSSIKTKAYTQTRIERLLLHILFEITREDFRFIDQEGIQYLRILGFSKKGEKLLTQIKRNTSLPLITQPADYLQSINKTSQDPLIKMLSYDLLASDIYTLLYQNADKRKGHLDFYHPVIKMS